MGSGESGARGRPSSRRRPLGSGCGRAASWPLPGDFHAILCRNVSIYFADEERITLLERLAGSLRTGGWLIMGNGEILPTVPVGLRKILPSIYRKEG